MLPSATLRAIAQARVLDAEVLLANMRFDSAGYICGYAIEFGLKARICDTLNWVGYPQTRKEFENLKSFQTHDLEVLLALSGREQSIKRSHLRDWHIVSRWSPETRYRAVGAFSSTEAQRYLNSTNTLLPLI